MFSHQTTLSRLFFSRYLYIWKSHKARSVSTDAAQNIKVICKHLMISESKAQYLLLKQPSLKKCNNENMKNIISTLYDLGFSKNILIKEPGLFSILPLTIKYRFSVLQECGITNVTPADIVSYLPLLKQKTIGELKKSGLIPNTINIENRLAGFMTQWPSSLTTLVYGDLNDFTLYSLRLKIIQRYLELMLDLNQDEFNRALHTYPTIRHRPLKTINETLNILQNEINMSISKIKSNCYLIHSDPENLKNLLYKLRTIAGIDIKEILRLHPKLAMVKYATMIETRKLLEEYGFFEEAQKRCFQIYTLSPVTIRERLEKTKTIPEFNTFFKHPRFLKMIFYNKTALTRLMKLYNSNKKCMSLNILSGSSAHYEVYEKAPGDRLGKGKDLLFCITEALDNLYSMGDVRNVIKRHPFWINIPIVQVRFVYEQLSIEFSAHDIYENCPILLYPWNKIREILNVFNKNNKLSSSLFEQIDISLLTKSQKLSMILYLLEKNHYFTGNGVWSEEKQKNIVDLTEKSQEINEINSVEIK